jgi:hypothetical protein
MCGGDYKGEPSDYQTALKKWNISKGWQETKIWQAPYKQKKYKKASPEYGEVLEMMKTSRTTGMAEAEALYEKLLENTKFKKAKVRVERGEVMRRIMGLEDKRVGTSDERKWAQTLRKFIEEVRQQNIEKFGEDPLGEAVPAAEAAAEAAPPAEAEAAAPEEEEFQESLSKERPVFGKNPKLIGKSDYEKYVNLMVKFDEYVETQPANMRDELRSVVVERQKEIMGDESIAKNMRLSKLQQFIAVLAAPKKPAAPAAAAARGTINLKPVDDMRTKDVLIEANVLAGNEAQAKRVEVPGGSRSTPKDFGTSIADGRARLKEYRQAIYGKTEGIVMKNPKYNLRPGSLM